MSKVDVEYASLCRDIMAHGAVKETRSGKVISLFGRMMRFDLSECLPILTTKKMYTKGVIHELLWFLSGSTNIKYLAENNVHIWDDDAYRWYLQQVDKHNSLSDLKKGDIENTLSSFFNDGEKPISVENDGQENFYLLDPPVVKKIEPFSKEEFLSAVLRGDKISFVQKPSYTCGDLGDVYGKSWRSFGTSGRDQIKEIINTLKANPDDRRMLCVAFNPDVVDSVALPPCHVMFQFYTNKLSFVERIEIARKQTEAVKDNISVEELDVLGIPKRKLSCMWSQRSVDFGLGWCFNLLSYSILTHMIAQVANMVPDEIICSLGDCHIYENQLEGIHEQLERDPSKYGLPRLVLNKDINNIDDFTYDDISIEGYESYPKITMPLSVGL